ncbi:MAG: PilC/PilY family type IV pilus protein [Rugosibacter sp.]|nr:PilC/PilY family type IV pilus protein [Rugosibacter sp.]
MQSKFRKILTAVLMGGALLSSSARADDIDLYVGGEQSTGAAANVLIVLDNSTNWAAMSQHWTDGSTQGESELQTLSEIANTLSDNINVGLMIFGRDGGGLVRSSIREMNNTNRPVFKQILDYMAANAPAGSDPDEVPSNTNYDDMMNSAFRYFAGKDKWKDGNGSSQDRRDYNGNLNNTAAQPSTSAGLGGFSLSSSTATTYNPPVSVSEGCAKNYIIFIGNGFPSNVGSAAELTAAGTLVGATPDTSQVISMSPKNPYADEWTRFMYTSGVPSVVNDSRNPGVTLRNKIATYTIDVCKDACDSSQATLLKSMAKVGGGKYFRSTSKASIKSALSLIFAEIQAVNSVFASATLPISVNTQGTFENQVYIGVFRPDANARPRWFGNLKEYKFGRYCDADRNDKVLIDSTRAYPLTGTFSATDERVADDVLAPDCGSDAQGRIDIKLYLADKNGYRAIDEEGNTGFIDLSAASHWTTPSSYWSFMPTVNGSISDSPDGPAVERGGAAQRLRTHWAEAATSPNPDGRKVYTCLGTCLATGATTAQKTLSNNVVSTANAEVTGALVAPSGSVSVTLARSGNTVTATVASGTHGFVDGSSVVVAGATPTAYNGTQSVTTGGSTTAFTYTLAETPAAVSAGAATLATSPIGISSVTLSAGTPGATVTATINAVATVTGTLATVAGTGLSYIDGSRVRTNFSPGPSYTFSTTLPAAPGNATGIQAVGGGSTATGLTGSYDAANNRFTVTSGSNLPGALKNAPAGTSVVISNSSDAKYNGTWSVLSSSNKTLTFTYRTYAGCSPCTGATIAAAGATSDTVTIARSVGSTTATATRTSNNLSGLANGDTVIISGTSGYDGNWNVSAVDNSAQTFQFGPLTLGPATPASGSITATLSGAGSGPTTANLINWTRGKDLWEDENLDGLLTDVRASIHGDVLHSRPVVVNYGASIGIVGFYGSNDGFLRAIKGGIADTEGQEKWAFVAQEFMNYSKLARLYSNSEPVRYPNLACGISPAPTQRGYFWDGPLTAYQTADGTPSTPPSATWLYAAMRRGGRALYAFDVTDPDVPALKWRITNGTTGFSELGQTWSEPKIIKLKGISGGVAQSQLALAFGAGYDAAQEDQPTGSVRTVTMGRGVFVVDADTGAKISLLSPPAGVQGYSFAADVTPLDLDGDGYVDRIYAADTGGNVFRFDAVQTAAIGTAGYWKTYHIAEVGDAGNDGGADARKFLFAPEVVPFRDAGVLKANILIGSGDREKPLANKKSDGTSNALTCAAYYSDAYYGATVTDRLFGLIDTVPFGAVEATVNASPTTVTDLQMVNADSSNLAAFSLSSAYKGWSILLKNDPAGSGTPGEEKAVNQARVVGGVAFFATNTPVAPDPSQGICTNLGEALGYAVDPFTGLPAINRDGSTSGGAATYTGADYATQFAGGGLPPTVTAGVVSIGGTPYRFIIGSGGAALTSASSIAGQRNILNIKGTRSRLYWSYGAD